MAEHSSHEKPLNLELVGYDELGWMPVIGRASDSERALDVPDGTLRPRSEMPRRPAAREFLASDFSFSQWS